MSSEKQNLLESEARYWINWAREHGRDEWLKAKDRMRKRRGAKNVQKLVDEMNKQMEILTR